MGLKYQTCYPNQTSMCLNELVKVEPTFYWLVWVFRFAG